ncbi:hypothetical protein EGR_07102 [Echinococcus granulosus]|uniref:DUF5727 domain-containing protein n=1 Tax=Echinococcus granulosus TaxID=6210 RepID=W6UBR6_ECHGR|nr:hypothetical protein EGR_07102 [Echinococcus granulosus]EUB57996.1 hypothetical protein EGR_07102 [Echinococcus granulosus]
MKREQDSNQICRMERRFVYMHNRHLSSHGERDHVDGNRDSALCGLLHARTKPTAVGITSHWKADGKVGCHELSDPYILCTATITVDDVNRQKSIDIYQDVRYDSLFLTAFFVPYCNFSQPGKADLVKNTSSNLRIFRGTFSIPPGVEYETFSWVTTTSGLSVSVDYTQNGEHVTGSGGMQSPARVSACADVCGDVATRWTNEVHPSVLHATEGSALA